MASFRGSPYELLEQIHKTQRSFNIIMSAIASISLLVGGIGIMNIMLANMLERMHGIAVCRRLVRGATTGASQLDPVEAVHYE